MRNNLIEARRRKELTQKQLAEQLNISERHYQAIEAGTSEGSLKVWKQLKQLFNLSIDHLIE